MDSGVRGRHVRSVALGVAPADILTGATVRAHPPDLAVDDLARRRQPERAGHLYRGLVARVDVGGEDGHTLLAQPPRHSRGRFACVTASLVRSGDDPGQLGDARAAV